MENREIKLFLLKSHEIILKVQMSKTPTPKTESFCVIGGVQYEMTSSEDKPFQIANWFHNHYARIEENAEVEQEMLQKARPNGYHEEGDKIYVVSHIKK